MLQLPEGEFIPLDEYMALCNAHYYATRGGIGAEGDFITAPEISQMFGELIGAWIVIRWQQLGCPAPFSLIELGPGKGTLMADALRVLQEHAEIISAAQIHLVETSPTLRAAQKKSLAEFALPVFWHDDLAAVPSTPFILIANEFFDALPIRQFIYAATGWQERGVRTEKNRLVWAARAVSPSEIPIPSHLPPPIPGNRLETCPALPKILDTLAARAAVHAGSALIVDYGYGASDYGDTFQAVSHHEYADPLENAGGQDLTAHVNFAEIENFSKARGLQCAGPASQGEFLVALGLQHRAEKLLTNTGDPEDKLEIIEALHRLTAPAEMGTLFKVMCLSSPYLSWPEGFPEGVHVS